MLIGKQAMSGFVLPLQEVNAHFAHQDLRSIETEVGGSDYGNALRIDISAVGLIPLLG
jgi:hypothetical protein